MNDFRDDALIILSVKSELLVLILFSFSFSLFVSIRRVSMCFKHFCFKFPMSPLKFVSRGRASRTNQITMPTQNG